MRSRSRPFGDDRSRVCLGALPPGAAQRCTRPSAGPLRSRLCRPGDPPPLRLAPPILAEGQGCGSRAAQPAVQGKDDLVAMQGGGTRVRARRPSPWRQPPRLLPASVGLEPVQLRLTRGDRSIRASAARLQQLVPSNRAYPVKLQRITHVRSRRSKARQQFRYARQA